MTTEQDQRGSNASVTLDDVLCDVGVSARTVSRVVNNEGGCAVETRHRILEAIKELGYRPNLMARGLTRRRSDTIGLIAAELLDPFFPEVADGIQRAANELDRTMFLAGTDSDAERQRHALTSLFGHGVDGAIVFPARDSHDDLISLAGDGLPIVVVNSEISAPGIASINAEIAEGAELAVEHLVDRGRTRIAMITDVNTHHGERTTRREIAYRSVLKRAGLPTPDEYLIPAENSLNGGRVGAQALLQLDERPDAIFTYNDLMALGALQELLSSGVRVPEDIALVGFDDISMCKAATPQLTSVRIDRDLLGRKAVELLRDLVDEVDSARTPVRIPVELIVRGSS